MSTALSFDSFAISTITYYILMAGMWHCSELMAGMWHCSELMAGMWHCSELMAGMWHCSELQQAVLSSILNMKYAIDCLTCTSRAHARTHTIAYYISWEYKKTVFRHQMGWGFVCRGIRRNLFERILLNKFFYTNHPRNARLIV